MFLLFVSLSSCKNSPKDPWIYMVNHGRPHAVVMDFDGWKQGPGYMIGNRKTNMIYGRQALIGEDFWVDMEFRHQEKDGLVPVGFVEFGGNHCWFDYRKDRPSLWLSGPAIGDTLNFPDHIIAPKTGELVKLRMQQSDGFMNVFLQGKLALRTALKDTLKGKVGLYTRYGESQLSQFRMAGNLKEVPKESYSDAVFIRGEEGYNCFRIPALTRSSKGNLIAVCEGRKDSRSDFGDVDLVMKRSTDGGESWGKLQVLHEEGGTAKIEMGNPCVLSDDSTGKVHIVFSRKVETLLHLYSEDGGLTWQGPKVIHRPDVSGLFPNHAVNASPGHGIQIRRGAHAGRLVVPVYTRLPDSARYTALDSLNTAVIYSDDGGKSWQAGGLVDRPGSNESMVVELADGRLMMLFRMYPGRKKVKYRCYSSDGGKSWGASEEVAQLMDPICQASLLAIPSDPKAENRVLLFTNPAHPVYYNRSRLALKVSHDEGKTWLEEKLLWPKAASYSDMVELPERQVGYLLEFGYHFNYEAIVFRKFKVK